MMRLARRIVGKAWRVVKWSAMQPRERWLINRACRQTRATARVPIISGVVVLVTDSVSSRVCKIGYGLKRAGWQPILLHRGQLPVDPARCFAETVRFSSSAEALLLATRFRPVVFHLFSNWNFDVAALFIRHKPGKIVFDDYDVLAGTLVEKYLKTFGRAIIQERFCLEHADGLCCRDLESQCVKRAGYRFGGPRLLLPDCCWGDLPLPSHDGIRRPDEGFHIVNCGNIPVATREEWDVHRKELTQLAGRLVEQGLTTSKLHFHIYPMHGVWPGAISSSAVPSAVIGKLEVLFHLHARVAPDVLHAELAKYDAGLYHVGLAATPPTYNHWKFVYTSGNRVFDYFDAGLPVVIHGSKFMEFFVKRAGAGILMEEALPPEQREYLQQRGTGQLRRNAIRARSDLAITRFVPHLTAYYNAL